MTIDRILGRCKRACAERTLRGYGNDLEIFRACCDGRGHAWLPALPSTVSAFIDEETTLKAFATVKRRVKAVKFAHRMADVEHSEVRLAMHRAKRTNSSRPKQARGLTREWLERIIAACPDDLAGRRDAAIICVGYDSLA